MAGELGSATWSGSAIDVALGYFELKPETRFEAKRMLGTCGV
jgi:hypothetical protein